MSKTRHNPNPKGKEGNTEGGKRRRGRPNIREDVPVTLAPLDFETALAGLLQVPPESEGKSPKKATKKKATKKTVRR